MDRASLSDQVTLLTHCQFEYGSEILPLPLNTDGGPFVLLLVLVATLSDVVVVLDEDSGPRTDCVLLILLSETRPTVDLDLT